MMSKKDPMRALGMQEEAVETSLVTRKFFSSIFCWKELHKSQEGESKNTKEKPWSLHFGAPSKGLLLPFIATRRLTKGEPVTQQYMDAFMAVFMAAFTDTVKEVIMQILQIVTSLVSTE